MTEIISDNKIEKNSKPAVKGLRSLIPDLLLVLLLVIGASYRLIGLGWDADQHVHPDELFLTNVESAIRPVESFSEY